MSELIINIVIWVLAMGAYLYVAIWCLAPLLSGEFLDWLRNKNDL
jgi:hypothetical protein